MNVVLTACLGIPLATAMVLMLFRSSLTHQTTRWIAVCGSLLTLGASVLLMSQYVSHARAKAAFDGAMDSIAVSDAAVHPKILFEHDWMNTSDATEQGGVRLQMLLGIDGISTALISLTALLTFCSVLTSWDAIRERSADFFVALMILETGLIGVFCSFDLIQFYVFFEMTLIPLFFLIAIWGGPDRRHAAMKFFLYTLGGSLVTLTGLIILLLHVANDGLATPASLPALAEWLKQRPLPPAMQVKLFLAVSAGFLIKVPVFPFHTWLPLAHVEAPTAGSVLLAGVLLKLGTYGFLRLCLPLFPEACVTTGLPAIGLLSVIGIVYGSLCALAQRDLKKLVAYSSVAHLGFCTLGLFALNTEGLTGSVMQMINHGLSTGALFLIVGMIYERYHTRMLDDLSGLASRLPLIGCSMVFISMASIGLPGLNGFVGEFLSLAGMFRRHSLYGIIGAAGVVLGAWYLLTALQHMFFGNLKESHGEDSRIARDLSFREFLSLAPIAAMCLWIGVRPMPLINLIQPDIQSLAARFDAAEPDTAAALSPGAPHALTDDITTAAAATSSHTLVFLPAESPRD
ncbi:MAG: NADH-quinone oxidoreductase subunit M [Planctomycetaceae bacterium]